MEISPLFCCFSDKRQNCIVLTGLVSSFIAISFLIWGLVDIWFDGNGTLAIYIIAFILICISMIGFVLLFIIVNLRKTEYSMTFYYIGKIICLIIFIISILAFVFMLTAFIILIVDYADIEKDIPGQYFPSHEWAAVFVPSILALVGLIFMILVANILYIIFRDKLLTNTNPIDISRNTVVSTISNQPTILDVNNSTLQQSIQPKMKPVEPPMHPVIEPVIQPVRQPVMQSVTQSPIQPRIQPVIQPEIQPQNRKKHHLI